MPRISYDHEHFCRLQAILSLIQAGSKPVARVMDDILDPTASWDECQEILDGLRVAINYEVVGGQPNA